MSDDDAAPRMDLTTRRRWMMRNHTKAELVVMYRELGGGGGIHPVESWRKDEIAAACARMAAGAARMEETRREGTGG